MEQRKPTIEYIEQARQKRMQLLSIGPEAVQFLLESTTEDQLSGERTVLPDIMSEPVIRNGIKILSQTIELVDSQLLQPQAVLGVSADIIRSMYDTLLQRIEAPADQDDFIPRNSDRSQAV